MIDIHFKHIDVKCIKNPNPSVIFLMIDVILSILLIPSYMYEYYAVFKVLIGYIVIGIFILLIVIKNECFYMKNWWTCFVGTHITPVTSITRIHFWPNPYQLSIERLEEIHIEMDRWLSNNLRKWSYIKYYNFEMDFIFKEDALLFKLTFSDIFNELQDIVDMMEV